MGTWRSLAVLAVLAVPGPPAAAAPRLELVVANEVLDPRFVDRNLEGLLRRFEEVGGWKKGSLQGKAFPRPREALDHIRKNKTPFAILPVHQFLEGRKELGFEVVGRAVGLEGPGPAYWGVARNEPRPYEHIETYPGLTLAMTETYDPQWISVLFEGFVDPRTHFKLLEVPSGQEAVAAVLARKADVALLYESDFQPLKPRIESKTDLAWVYTSGGVPPPAVVATRWASKADRKRMTQALDKLCKQDGAPACGRMAILYAQSNRADSYRNVIEKYETYR